MFWKQRVYLDWAAGRTPNPSSPHEEGREAKRILEHARTSIARLTEVQADDVVFTGSATEANALAILGHVRALRARGKKNAHVLYLPSAHASIVENAKILSAEGVRVEPLPIKDFRVDSEACAAMLTPETALVSMEAVCGETGVIWNVRDVANLLRGKGVVLHVDASQAPLIENITRAHFNADMITMDGSKVGNTRGIGVLIAHRTIPLTPLYRGGGQERGVRSGSEAYELAREFAVSLAAAVKGRELFRARAQRAREELVRVVTGSVQNVYIHESRKSQAPHILTISLPGRDTDYLLALLDEAGYAVSTRSACETDSENGSRAVFELTKDAEHARSTLRISWGPGVKMRHMRAFARELGRAIAFIDRGMQG